MKHGGHHGTDPAGEPQVVARGGMDGTDAGTPLLAVAFGSEAGRALGWRHRGAALHECGGLWVSRLLGGSLTWGYNAPGSWGQ